MEYDGAPCRNIIISAYRVSWSGIVQRRNKSKIPNQEVGDWGNSLFNGSWAVADACLAFVRDHLFPMVLLLQLFFSLYSNTSYLVLQVPEPSEAAKHPKGSHKHIAKDSTYGQFYMYKVLSVSNCELIYGI